MPTEAEFILGTRDDRADSDQDGISDLQELINRSNPADGLPTSPGIIASVDTPGDARDVAVGDSMALVADGPAGVAVVNLSDPRRPTLLTRIPGSGKPMELPLRVASEPWRSVREGWLCWICPIRRHPRSPRRCPFPDYPDGVDSGRPRVCWDRFRGIFQIEAATGTVVNSLSIPGASP